MVAGAKAEAKGRGGGIFHKSFATTWQTRFSIRFFSPLGEHVSFKNWRGAKPPSTPLAQAQADLHCSQTAETPTRFDLYDDFACDCEETARQILQEIHRKLQ